MSKNTSLTTILTVLSVNCITYFMNIKGQISKTAFKLNIHDFFKFSRRLAYETTVAKTIFELGQHFVSFTNFI